jgi:CheY-like chemotaxis protein
MTPLKILLAEDDIDDKQLFFEFLGHRSDLQLLPVTENGVVLLQSLENITSIDALPDIIILDQNMPKKNGLQTLVHLKETPRYAHIPVVIYSTYTDQQLIVSCTAAGATAVLTKPISKDGYEEMMGEILGKI